MVWDMVKLLSANACLLSESPPNREVVSLVPKSEQRLEAGNFNWDAGQSDATRRAGRAKAEESNGWTDSFTRG